MRETHQIGRKAGASILHSARTAERIGRPLNFLVTINFWQLGGDADSIFREFADLREKWFARWSRTVPKRGYYKGEARNGVPTYAYVHEATKGLPHTHWLLHIRPANIFEFRNKMERWLRKRYGVVALPEGAVDIKPVYNSEGAKLYLAKGLDPFYADAWGIRAEDTGRISHRRADTSRNLGPSIWKAFKKEYRRNEAA